MKKKRTIFITLCFLMLLSFQVEAKKPNYQKIYGKILKQSSVSVSENGRVYTFEPFNCFVLFDINRDGKKELIAETGWYRQCFIYTIKGNKAKLVDSVNCFFTTDWNDKNHNHFIEYNKKYKGLVLHQHGGTGLAGRDILQIKNGKMKLICSIESYTRWENGKTLTTYSDNYMKYYNKYFKTAKKVYMHENNASSRKKYLK